MIKIEDIDKSENKEKEEKDEPKIAQEVNESEETTRIFNKRLYTEWKGMQKIYK